MLAKLDVVDVVSSDPEGRDYELAIVAEAGEWSHPNALLHLQEKVNGCLAFGLDGEMHRRHPDSIGKPLTIAIASVDPCPEFVHAFIERIRPIVQGDGVQLVVRELPQHQAA